MYIITHEAKAVNNDFAFSQSLNRCRLLASMTGMVTPVGERGMLCPPALPECCGEWSVSHPVLDFPLICNGLRASRAMPSRIHMHRVLLEPTASRDRPAAVEAHYDSPHSTLAFGA